MQLFLILTIILLTSTTTTTSQRIVTDRCFEMLERIDLQEEGQYGVWSSMPLDVKGTLPGSSLIVNYHMDKQMTFHIIVFSVDQTMIYYSEADIIVTFENEQFFTVPLLIHNPDYNMLAAKFNLDEASEVPLALLKEHKVTSFTFVFNRIATHYELTDEESGFYHELVNCVHHLIK
jgi:hypothetical protein